MENSQQENEDGLSFCGMKKHSLLMISLLVSFFLVPVQAQGEPICEGSECSVSFSYTGEMQTWKVPDAAVNLRFEIYVASGARGGGGGLAEDDCPLAIQENSMFSKPSYGLSERPGLSILANLNELAL